MREQSPRRVLFVSYYFPPESSSGVHRAINFVRHLPVHGWLPTILTVSPDAYPPDSVLDVELLQRLSPDASIIRTHVLGVRRIERGAGLKPNAARPGSVERRGGPALRWLKARLRPWFSCPDDKLGWLVPAVWCGWRALRQRRHDAILSTGGPWTGFLVGALLARLTGLPLVLDYRDPWTASPHPPPRPRWRQRLDAVLERAVARSASAIVANTLELQELLQSFLGSSHSKSVYTITNGFDPDIYAAVPRTPRPINQALSIIHTGHIYRHRSPEGLFRALGEMRASGELPDNVLKVGFVGDADLDLEELVTRFNLASTVEVHAQVSHRASVQKLMDSDVVLLIQTGTQLQIPAKVYEYIGARKWILALTDSHAIRRLITDNGLGVACQPHDVQSIRTALRDLTRAGAGCPGTIPSGTAGHRFSAGAISAQLAGVLHEVVDHQKQATAADARAGVKGLVGTE